MKIDEAAERAKFEAHIDKSPIEGVNGMGRWPDGRYHHAALQKAWNVWKAALAAMPERDASATSPRSVEGEAVAVIRHFNYSGIARNGFSQEPVMLDDAPILPAGTKLYTHPAPAAVDGKTQEYTLRAMAMNYSGGHSWDHLDSDACRNGANEIASLRALLATANSAEGKVVPDELASESDDHPDAALYIKGWNDCRGAMVNAHKASAKGER